MTTNDIVQKTWNFCHTFRDDGINFGKLIQVRENESRLSEVDQLEITIKEDL